MLGFWQFFKQHAGQAKSTLSVRDLLAWASFINSAAESIGPIKAYIHGAQLGLLDGIGLGIGMPVEVKSHKTPVPATSPGAAWALLLHAGS